MRLAPSLCVRVFAATLISTTPAFAATLHVSPSGSNSNPGTLSAPLLTPARALELANDGDTILLRGGTYSITRSLAITQDGISLRSYPGEWARLVAGTSDLTNLTSVVIVYSSNVKVEYLELQGASYYGIKLDEYYSPQTGNVVRGLYIHHTGRDGMKIQQADGVVIENNEVAFTGVRDSSNAEGIDVMGSIGATVRQNYVHDIATTGIFVKAGTRRAVIEANRVERTGHAGILVGSESGAQFMRDGALQEAIDSVARNNIVIDTALAGLGSIAGDNIRFENNTVINAARTGQAVFRSAANGYGTKPRNVLLKNNVFVLASSSTRPMVHLNNYSGAITSNYNIWYSSSGKYSFWREVSGGTNSYWSSLGEWQNGANADWNSRAADPGLDSGTLYRPRSGSAAIDTGERLSTVTADYSGTTRPQGSTHDIGAHEGTTKVPAPPTGVRIVR